MNNSFEKHIFNYLDTLRNCEIKDAMAYALADGKRIRPLVLFSILKGMGINEEKGYDAAMALEFIQTYSLIHDDLPAMDNDDFRRGKPSLHKAYREDIAILTGDELLTDSFSIISNSNEYDSESKVNMITALSKYSGLNGMIYGQLLDVTTDSKQVNKELLVEIQDNKTSGLFKIACLMAMYINHEENKSYYEKLGSLIGQIFQNQDDLFDVLKTQEEMGKSLSDIANDKGSALSLYSIEQLKQLINSQFDEIYKLLENASFDTIYLKEILEKIRNR